MGGFNGHAGAVDIGHPTALLGQFGIDARVARHPHKGIFNAVTGEGEAERGVVLFAQEAADDHLVT